MALTATINSDTYGYFLFYILFNTLGATFLLVKFVKGDGVKAFVNKNIRFIFLVNLLIIASQFWAILIDEFIRKLNIYN